jgi:formyl-CoA transferase
VSEQPFAGVTVLEFGHFIAVPWAGQVLADGGAHVVKIEPPEGEPSRHIAPLGGGESRHFLIRNRGKHALPLDLRHRDAREVLDALLARADVVLTNMRPGLAAELGLEYEQLGARWPRLVVGSVTAFGTRGPDAALAGMDLVVQGRSGLMVTGGRVKDGLPTTGESPIADYMAAALLAFGVASALFRRERTGRGGRVDTSLLLAALALQNNLMVRVEDVDGPRHAAFAAWLKQARAGGVAFAEQVEKMPRNRVLASQAIYIRSYATKDAALTVACGSPALRRKFIAAIGHTDAALGDAVADQEAHYAALRTAVEATLASRTTGEWKAVLDAAGVPVSGIALPLEILDDPQPVANAMFHRFEHDALGSVTVLGPPVRVDGGGFAPGAATPPFGSEVRGILAWAGFGERDIERLLAGGALTAYPPQP